ncbi:O-antigen ligase family protein [Methylotenera sp. G11]|uniref:O-antigen ligase family protein n=1 Tax=Methylotenera sp. G11 TaxID=1506585 RepID=UPI000A6421A7|nr:O-antigen ligase family protein [Methylotenera sp. G11]
MGIAVHSASRGVLLAWIVGILITACIYRKLAWPFIRLQLMHITARFLSYQILFELIPFLRGFAVVTGTVVRDTTSDRIALWGQALRLIQEHPLLGIGPMQFAWHSPSAHTRITACCNWRRIRAAGGFITAHHHSLRPVLLAEKIQYQQTAIPE